MNLDRVDVTKVKAHGPWVLVEVEDYNRKTEGGLYLPEGNLYERIGYAVGKVLSAGKGYRETLPGKTKEPFIVTELNPGDRVLFRGHMKDANKLSDRHCFMHIRDLLGVMEEGVELGFVLPYDN
jgi:co-chaperonin GroES (HSP10)